MRKPKASIDYTNKDYEAFRTDMIASLQAKLPQYTDTSQSDAGIVLIELLARGLDVLSYYQDTNANECFLPSSQQRTNLNKWCKTLGYSPIPASPSRYDQVFKLSYKQNTPVTIPKGTVITTPNTASEPSVSFETATNLIIPPQKLGDEVDEVGAYLYTVESVQGYTINEDAIGFSNGSSNQKFKLNTLNAIPDTLEVSIYNGIEYERWNNTDSFINSLSSSPHYLVEQDENGVTMIHFGDNYTGKIPFSSTRPIYVTYRVGGGEKGNVAPNTIIILENSSMFIAETFNPYEAIEKGVEKETNESIKINAPISARIRWGLITLLDFDNYIQLNYNKSIITSSSVRDLVNPLKVNIYLLEKPPYAYTDIKDILTEDLTDRILIGGEFSINPPDYITIDLIFDLILEDYYLQSQVQERVNTYVTNYFKLGNYPFNQELIFNTFCNEIFNLVEGLKSIKMSSLGYTDLITPSSSEILLLGDVTFNVIGGIS